MNEYNYYSDPYANQDAKNREAAYLQGIIDTAQQKLSQLEGNTQTDEPRRTWTYYQNLKKTDRNAWNDPKTQVQMLQDRMALGEAFEDGNFDPHLGRAR